MRMNKAKQRYLEARGWKVGGTDEFLQLTPGEKEFIELKLALARKVREHRQKQNLTQMEMARLVGSSQSRVAKIEAGDPTVSFDLLIRSLIALGATQKELARAIGSAGR